MNKCLSPTHNNEPAEDRKRLIMPRASGIFARKVEIIIDEKRVIRRNCRDLGDALMCASEESEFTREA